MTETSRQMTDRHVRETRREALVFAVAGGLIMAFGMAMGQIWPLDWVYAMSGPLCFFGGGGLDLSVWLLCEGRQIRIDQNRHQRKMSGR